MADQDFNGIALAIAEQTDFGYVNATVRDLSGALAVDDGIILGDKESGDAESGITIPNLSAFSREVPQVVSSFTQSADYFLREVVEGLAITFPLKGNGADAGTPASPTPDAAVPDEGIASLYANAGLLGATGTGSPDWKYTPRATTIYSTVHLWVADLDFIFQDCLVDTLEFAFTPGETALVTASFKVGSVQSYNADVTFPTFTWGFQSSLAPPVVENVNFGTFGLTRGFEDLKISIANNVVEFKDSNVATTGLRQSQVDRVITVDGRMYLNETTSDAAHTSLVNTSAPTAALSLQLGTADSDGEVTALNAISMNVLNLQPKDIKYDRTGTAAVVEISGAKATGTTAGSEFMFEYN